MKNSFFPLVFVSLVVISRASKYTDCGSTTGQVSGVEVSNCPDGQDVCPLTRGSDATITIHFNSKADSKTLRGVVHGVIADVPLPFPLPEPDACKRGVTCPVKQGQSYTYSNNLDIRRSYPPVSVTVRYELKDEHESDMVCVEIPCKIQ